MIKIFNFPSDVNTVPGSVYVLHPGVANLLSHELSAYKITFTGVWWDRVFIGKHVFILSGPLMDESKGGVPLIISRTTRRSLMGTIAHCPCSLAWSRPAKS